MSKIRRKVKVKVKKESREYDLNGLEDSEAVSIECEPSLEMFSPKLSAGDSVQNKHVPAYVHKLETGDYKNGVKSRNYSIDEKQLPIVINYSSYNELIKALIRTGGIDPKDWDWDNTFMNGCLKENLLRKSFTYNSDHKFFRFVENNKNCKKYHDTRNVGNEFTELGSNGANVHAGEKEKSQIYKHVEMIHSRSFTASDQDIPFINEPMKIYPSKDPNIHEVLTEWTDRRRKRRCKTKHNKIEVLAEQKGDGDGHDNDIDDLLVPVVVFEDDTENGDDHANDIDDILVPEIVLGDNTEDEPLNCDKINVCNVARTECDEELEEFNSPTQSEGEYEEIEFNDSVALDALIPEVVFEEDEQTNVDETILSQETELINESVIKIEEDFSKETESSRTDVHEVLTERVKKSRKQHQCLECGKIFNSAAKLQIHITRHIVVKPYVCTQCSKTFAKRSDFLRHERMHLGIKPFQCQECSKSFSDNSHLSAHMRIHLGYKPFSCDICGKTFSQNSYLTAHKKSHMDIKQLVCETCNKSFSNRSHLNAHKKLHERSKKQPCKLFNCPPSDEKPFQCAECYKCFTQKGNLDTHMLIHKGIKPFKCEFCNRLFSQKGNLRKHVENKHSAEVSQEDNYLY